MTPIEWILLIVSALSSAYATKQQNKSSQNILNAQGAARDAEQRRQQRIDEERKAAVNATLPKHTATQQEASRQDLSDKANEYIAPEDRVALSGEYTADNPGAPTEISDRLSAQLAGALSKGKDYAKNLANLRSYNDLNTMNTMDMNRLTGNANMLNSFSQGSAALIPGEMEAANRAGDGAMQRADIAGGLANLAFNSWLRGGSATKKPAVAGKPGPSLNNVSWSSGQL